MINIRKLVALDMLLHGARFILMEFAFGILLPFLFAFINLRSFFAGNAQPLWVTVVGFWLIGIGINYIPPFIYAVIIARKGSIEEEGQPERVNIMKYSIQQVIIFIPLIIVVLAVIQESQRKK
jgi:hypothetical protein